MNTDSSDIGDCAICRTNGIITRAVCFMPVLVNRNGLLLKSRECGQPHCYECGCMVHPYPYEEE